MKTLLYTPAAQQDLAGIVEYISQDAPQAAMTWVDKIEARCMLIASHPSTGELQPGLGEGVRSTTIGRYVVFHREKVDCVEILRLIAGDRDIRQL